MGPKPRAVMDRLVDKLLLGDGCWEWTGAKSRKGYGNILGPRRKIISTHRAAWEVWNGPIPSGAWILHRCDNPSCCRPDHLFLGDAMINNVDMRVKGRDTRGSAHPKSKLTESDVIAIRQAVANGAEQQGLAKQYGVSKGVLGRIVHRQDWRHVV